MGWSSQDAKLGIISQQILKIQLTFLIFQDDGNNHKLSVATTLRKNIYVNQEYRLLKYSQQQVNVKMQGHLK